MFAYIWPLALGVLANVVYQICAKSLPDGIHPLASLTVTYLVAAAASLVLFFALDRGGNLVREYGKLNWAPFALGIVLVGLEVGMIYLYRAGWQVNTGFIVQSTLVSIMLILVGFLLYREQLTWNKIVGVVVCLGGLVLINLK
ncbi:MAG: EamA family transporter [Clostridia bacterium]|nr:EamA family transporter [Clostridia bacterium]MBR3196579.1 EamA family transporter [Clostridia bacterium]